MNTSTFLRTTAAILSLAATASTMATAVQPTGDDMYDRIAQTRSQAAVTPAVKSANDAAAHAAVGGYARQLMYLGVDARQAVKIARSVGEQPLSVSVVPPQRQVGGFDLYDRIAARDAATSTSSMTAAVR